MKRLKTRWPWMTFPALCGAVALALWGILPRQDADVQWIGPKTKGVRTMLAGLEMRVAPAEFQECTKLKQVLEQLCEKCSQLGIEMPILVDREAIGDEDIYEADVSIANDSRPVTVKEFLRMVLRQATDKEITFLVRQHHFIEVTRTDEVNRQRADYDAAYEVTCIDRIRQTIAELLGGEGHLPPLPLVALR